MIRTEARVEAAPVRATGVRRWAWNTAGVVCLGLGALGALLPLLPTTCFLLLALACFSRGSERMHRWLLGNRWFGAQLEAYRRHRVLPARVKTYTVAVLWLGIGASIVVIGNPVVRAVLLGTGIAVMWHVLSVGTAAAAADGGD